MSDSPWNVPVPGHESSKAPKPATHTHHTKKEEHMVWNAVAKPNAGTIEKIKDKTRKVVEDAKDVTAKVTSAVEGYKNDNVAKVKKLKEDRKVAKEEKKADKKKAEESAGACGICGCIVM